VPRNKIALLAATATLLVAASPSPAAAGPASGPSCASGPSARGNAIVGTPCADVIRVPPEVAVVRGGGGDDVIVAAGTATAAACPEASCGIGSQTFYGGPGDDIVFGERGNDRLYGEGGDDRLYGGIGDDLLRGGSGDDRLSGGFGFDSIDGESGDDFARGDGTIDKLIADSGGGLDRDTLSYATGVTPGFPDNNSQFGPYPPFSTEYTGFPLASGERGVYIDLRQGVADNGIAANGGGVEAIEGGDFEVVIGTPFSDFIVGDETAETIYGGGGADVILGEDGDDRIYGGADGDSCDGATTDCETNAKEVAPRDASKISVGLMAPEEAGPAGLYLAGSDGDDSVTATYSTEPSAVTFELASGSFDESPAASGGCEGPTAAELVCPLADSPDSMVLAGLGGEDTLTLVGFPRTTSVYMLGGDGGDSLQGGEGEEVLVDGPDGASDTASAFSGDDALLNNGGADHLDGGSGNDLFVSNSICDGDRLDGGAQRDNASWAKFKESAVEARIADGVAGRPGGGSGPDCTGGALDELLAIEDLEGSREDDDIFYGGPGDNQLLGRNGADTYHALGGEDRILANSDDTDLVIDCGSDADVAFVDLPPPDGVGDPTPIDCETVYEAEPNDFQAPESPPEAPESAPSHSLGPAQASAASPARDTQAPRTRIRHRPGRRVLTAARFRRVVFVFRSNEPGARFRCRIDRRRFWPCRSPRAYRLRPGGHTFRVFAIDRAGNRDRSPAVFRFAVRRVSARWIRSHRHRARSRSAPRPRPARAGRSAR
jgi:Ca2+-binding RTX toxin-like protein